jgi:hypothetical protein
MNRYSYDVGIFNAPIEEGFLMADSIKDAHEVIDTEFAKVGVKEQDITHINIEHVNADDILGKQFEDVEKIKDTLRDLMVEMNISDSDILNRTTHLSNSICKRIIDILDL